MSVAVVLAPGSSTSAHATRAPAAAKASAVARPMPFAAPTTMAIFFSSVNVGSIIATLLIAALRDGALEVGEPGVGGEAAVGHDGGAGDERGLAGRQEQHRAGDLVRLADTSDRVGPGVEPPQLIGAV